MALGRWAGGHWRPVAIQRLLAEGRGVRPSSLSCGHPPPRQHLVRLLLCVCEAYCRPCFLPFLCVGKVPPVLLEHKALNLRIEVPTDRGDRRRLSPREGARTKGAAAILSRCGLEGCASAAELGCTCDCSGSVGPDRCLEVFSLSPFYAAAARSVALCRAVYCGRESRAGSRLGQLSRSGWGESPVCLVGLSQVLSQTHVRVRSLTFYDIKELVNEPATSIARRH